MNILHVIPYYYPALAFGGPVKLLHQLVTEQRKTDSVAICTSDAFNELRRMTLLEKAEVEQPIYHSKNIINSLAYKNRLFTHIGSFFFTVFQYKKFDVIHFHDVFVLPQLASMWFLKLVAHPYVVSPHGILDPARLVQKSLLKKLLLLVIQPIFRSAKTVVATSDFEKKILEDHYSLQNVTTIWNGVSGSLIKKQKKRKSVLSLLYIGKLHKHKGLSELLYALRSVKTSYMLTIAGPDDGALDELQTIVKMHALSVKFLPYVSEKEKETLYAQADVFVYPSYSEGFSISILEALAANVPVLITASCNFPHALIKKIGWCVETENLVENLESALTKISSELCRGKQFQGKQPRYVQQKYFSIQSMAEALKEVYCRSVSS